MTNLVVLNNHTLGYIMPELSKYVQVLHASVLKGATNSPHSVLIGKSDVIKLASEKDFNDFRVSFKGFDNEKEYKFKK